MTKAATSSSASKTSSTSTSIKNLRRRGRGRRPQKPLKVKMKRKAAESADLPTAIIASKKGSKKAKENVHPILITTSAEDKTAAADEVPDVADFQFEEADQEALSLFSTIEFDLSEAECLRKVDLSSNSNGLVNMYICTEYTTF